ncbi:MAG: cytochrome C oxidase subunit IV family protein [Bacteroidia bacterium]|nr:cytochrome C oxidase subunit IV family protein [Bacteroidia bacterium]MCF8445504.1 cytochrome C oxidase subunit IV family protein [Bacteroidia bacterium]
MEHIEEHFEHTETPADMKSQIWKTFWILLGFTVVDIFIYFMLLSTHAMWKNWVFIILGIVKAYYIVGVFMHMKFERKTLMYTIIVPMVFVVFFVTLMVIEGDFTNLLRWGK